MIDDFHKVYNALCVFQTYASEVGERETGLAVDQGTMFAGSTAPDCMLPKDVQYLNAHGWFWSEKYYCWTHDL